MMEWLTKEQVIERFCYGKDIMTSYVSLESLVGLIARAMVLDGHTVTDKHVWEQIIRPSMDNSESDFTLSGDVSYQLPTVVYMHYADWTERICSLLGHDFNRDIQPDVLDENACTRVVVRAMAAVAVKVSKAAEEAYQKVNGHSMAEVLMRSLETGEDFDQCRARLTMERRGLQTIH